MRSAKKAARWVGKKYSQDLAPAMADYWYAIRHHHAACSCFAAKKNDEEEDEDLHAVQGQSDEYQQKIPSKWTQRDVVSFVCQEVTMGDPKEFRICRLCRENEVDGTSLLAASDADLLELGFDPVSVRKLRSKIESRGHDNSSEQRIAELQHFLRTSGLGHLRERLMTQMGVYDRDELPTLIADKKWVKSVGLTLQDEIKLKSAIRQYAQGLATAETSKQLENVGALAGKQKSITIRKKVSAADLMNARRTVYLTVKSTGLDKVDIRSSAAGRPQWLMDVQARGETTERKVPLKVPEPVKWDTSNIFTPPAFTPPGNVSQSAGGSNVAGVGTLDASRSAHAAHASRRPRNLGKPVSGAVAGRNSEKSGPAYD